MGEVLRAAWLGEVVSMMVVREEEEEQGARCGGALRDDGARGRAIERFARTPRHAKRSRSRSGSAGRAYINRDLSLVQRSGMLLDRARVRTTTVTRATAMCLPACHA